MRQEPVGLLRAHQGAELVARGCRVDVPERDRVPARVPQELGRELRGIGAVEAVLHSLGRASDDLVPGEGDARGAFDGMTGHDRAGYGLGRQARAR